MTQDGSGYGEISLNDSSSFETEIENNNRWGINCMTGCLPPVKVKACRLESFDKLSETLVKFDKKLEKGLCMKDNTEWEKLKNLTKNFF